MWNENDIMSTTTETTISNKNKQNNNRFKRVNNKLYEPNRDHKNNIESYTKQLYTTNNNTNKTTSITTNTINNGCKLTLPSLSTNNILSNSDSSSTKENIVDVKNKNKNKK